MGNIPRYIHGGAVDGSTGRRQDGQRGGTASRPLSLAALLNDGDEGRQAWRGLEPGERGHIVTNERFFGLRDLSGASSAAGGYLHKSTQPMTVREALHAASVLFRAGAIYENPQGDFSPVPVVETPCTAMWLDPNGGGGITENDCTFGVRNPSLHLASASVDYTRGLRTGAGGIIEGLIVRELTRAVATLIDKAGVQGSGVGSEPSGLLTVSGTNSVSGTSLAWAGLLEMRRLCRVANAEPTAWLAGTTTAKLLEAREKAAGAGVILAEGKIDGLPCYVSNVVPEDALLCGDFRQLLVLEGNAELIVNPYTQSKTGRGEVTLIQSLDAAVLHAAAFSKAVSIT
jgi:HK97 family phage major capsid protein